MKSIRIDVDGAVGTITIDRRERFNSLDVETARDLRKAGLQLARDNAIRAVVLRGNGGVFCSGADLKYIRGGGDAKLDYSPLRAPASPRETARLRRASSNRSSNTSTARSPRSAARRSRSSPRSTASLPRADSAWPCRCDLVIASDRAMFEWAYAKTGLTGAESSTFMLPRLVGLRRAFELLFLNPRITPERALEIGLITAVYPAATFDAEVDAIAEQARRRTDRGDGHRQRVDQPGRGHGPARRPPRPRDRPPRAHRRRRRFRRRHRRLLRQTRSRNSECRDARILHRPVARRFRRRGCWDARRDASFAACASASAKLPASIAVFSPPPTKSSAPARFCENAAMTIDRIPRAGSARSAAPPSSRGAVLQCPQCHEPARLAAGDEIILQRVELEVA